MDLYGGSGKPFNAMNARRVKEYVFRGIRSKPADIDTEITAGRTAGGQFQDMEPAARSLQVLTKA